MTDDEPNIEQLEFWDGEVGEIWVRFEELLNDQLEPFSRVMFEEADLQEGYSVVDVGCGCGVDTIRSARKVGPTGHVLGLDFSSAMIRVAEQRADDEGFDHVEFAQADAQVYPFEPGSLDAAVSRFGIMFFSNPTAAFANIANALAPDRRLTFLTWQAVDKNPWMMLPVVEALQLVELDLPSDPWAPGPFTFADQSRLRAILSEAGFGRVDIDAYEPHLAVAGGQELDAAVEFVMEFLPMRRALKSATPEEREQVHEAIRGAIGPYARADGVIMPSAAWLVSATKY